MRVFLLLLPLFLLSSVPIQSEEVTGPEGKVYEKLLVPILGNGAGASGTRWLARLHAFNASNEVVRVTGHADLVDCPIGPTTCLGLIPPGATFFVGPGQGGNLTPSYVYVETHGLRNVYLTAEAFRVPPGQVRAGVGVSLPVVGEHQTSERVAIAAVPNVPGARYMLRIYGYDRIAWPVTITVRTTNRQFESSGAAILSFVPEERFHSPPRAPTYAQLELDPLLSSDPGALHTLIVEAPAGAKIWAMVSVTDNETEEFAIFPSVVALGCSP